MKTIFVGTGGLFWAGLPQMVTWLYRRGCKEVILFDPDTVESGNLPRQWTPQVVGQPKITAATDTLRGMMVEGAELTGIQMIVNHDLCQRVFACHPQPTDRLFVFCLPDNHMCRAIIHESCTTIAHTLGIPVHEITAGNTLEHGGAIGCIHQPDGTVQGDWIRRNRNILVEAGLEQLAIAQPMACGSMGDEPEQSSESNDLTAYCLWTLAEKSAREGWCGEINWLNNGQKILILEKPNEYTSTADERAEVQKEVAAAITVASGD